MSRPQTSREHLERCIRRCARHKDGRGPWQAEVACAEALGGSPIDRMAAAAARRVGEWLRTAPNVAIEPRH